MTMCSIQHGPLYITSPVDFSKIDTPFRLFALLDSVPTLVCVELPGESSNSLTLWKNHLYAVQHDTTLRLAISLR